MSDNEVVGIKLQLLDGRRPDILGMLPSQMMADPILWNQTPLVETDEKKTSCGALDYGVETEITEWPLPDKI